MAYYVYILASQPRGTLYIGVKSLVYVETHDEVERAIQREKSLRHWKRDWKIALIERGNPQWEDLYETLCG